MMSKKKRMRSIEQIKAAYATLVEERGI